MHSKRPLTFAANARLLPGVLPDATDALRHGGEKEVSSSLSGRAMNVPECACELARHGFPSQSWTADTKCAGCVLRVVELWFWFRLLHGGRQALVWFDASGSDDEPHGRQTQISGLLWGLATVNGIVVEHAWHVVGRVLMFRTHVAAHRAD